MDLSDNDLLDLLLARNEPAGELDRPAVREVLAQMRMPRTRQRRVRIEKTRKPHDDPSNVKATLSFSDGSPSDGVAALQRAASART